MLLKWVYYSIMYIYYHDGSFDFINWTLLVDISYRFILLFAKENLIQKSLIKLWISLYIDFANRRIHLLIFLKKSRIFYQLFRLRKKRLLKNKIVRNFILKYLKVGFSFNILIKICFIWKLVQFNKKLSRKFCLYFSIEGRNNTRFIIFNIL